MMRSINNWNGRVTVGTHLRGLQVACKAALKHAGQIVDAMHAQFPGVGGLKSIDRLRRRRNQAEYPNPQSYDPVTTDEAHNAVAAARSSLDAAGKLIAVPQLGIF